MFGTLPPSIFIIHYHYTMNSLIPTLIARLYILLVGLQRSVICPCSLGNMRFRPSTIAIELLFHQALLGFMMIILHLVPFTFAILNSSSVFLLNKSRNLFNRACICSYWDSSCCSFRSIVEGFLPNSYETQHQHVVGYHITLFNPSVCIVLTSIPPFF